jgi:glutamine synthetase
MSSQSDEAALLFDLYEWKHTSDGSLYIWEKDGHKVEAVYDGDAQTLTILLHLASGRLRNFPAITGYEAANDDDIRRIVEDTLAGASGRW